LIGTSAILRINSHLAFLWKILPLSFIKNGFILEQPFTYKKL